MVFWLHIAYLNSKMSIKSCLKKNSLLMKCWVPSKIITNKSPETDVFTTEFYKRFVLFLLAPLTKACNYFIKTGKLPPSWKQSKMLVLPNPGWDLTSQKLYRPISFIPGTQIKHFYRWVNIPWSIRFYSRNSSCRQHY